MPNWCDNSTVIYGRNNDIKKLRKILEDALSENPKEFKKVKNDWGNLWLGNLFLGCGYELIDGEFEEGIKARGGIESYDLNFEDGAIEIQYSSAWGPIISSIDKLLNEKFKGLKQVTIAGERSFSIFVNTDVEGKYYTDRYLLDYCIEEKYSDSRYFDSEEELLKAFNGFFKTDCKTFNETAQCAIEIRHEHCDDDSFFLVVEKFETE